jgi:hypothetical protein
MGERIRVPPDGSAAEAAPGHLARLRPREDALPRILREARVPVLTLRGQGGGDAVERGPQDRTAGRDPSSTIRSGPR